MCPEGLGMEVGKVRECESYFEDKPQIQRKSQSEDLSGLRARACQRGRERSQTRHKPRKRTGLKRANRLGVVTGSNRMTC